MAVFVAPSVTNVHDDEFINTTANYIGSQTDVTFDRTLILGGLFRSERMPDTPGEAPILKTAGNQVMRQAGREYFLPVATNSSTNTTTFRGADVLSTDINDVGTVQRAISAYYTDFAAIALTEELENAGPEKRMDTMQNRIDMALRTISDTMETDFWSTNLDTSSTQKGVIGIQHLIDETPTTGTCWGIDRSTLTWQGNQASDAGTVAFATNGLDELRSMFTTCASTGGTDAPTVHLTTPGVFNAYTEEAENIHQITKGPEVDLGFEFAVYRGRPVTYSSNCNAGSWYMLNLDYAVLLMKPGADFSLFFPPGSADQAISRQVRIVTSPQWGFKRFDRQGTIFNWTDT